MRRFTAEMVREMHQTYLSSDKTTKEVALGFGFYASSRMYELFERFGMKERRPKPVINPEVVRAIHEGYLTTELTVSEYAAQFGISSQLMFWWFRELELPLKGHTEYERPRVPGQESRLCPAARTHEACGECPCSEPKCKPEMEWHCGECAGKKRCVCWDPALREVYGFSEWYAGWKTEQDREADKWQRVQRMLRDGAKRWRSSMAVWQW